MADNERLKIGKKENHYSICAKNYIENEIKKLKHINPIKSNIRLI